MKGKLKIGVAGCGWIAEKAHIPAFKNITGVEVAALYDINSQSAYEVAGRNGIDKVYCDYESFLKSDIEAVIIATPNYTHAEYTRKALENGKHVLCEKPIALFASEITQEISIAQRMGKLFLPGFVNRFREDIGKIYNMVQNSEIGKVRLIKAGWVRRAGMPRPGTWFTNKKFSGGGVLVDLGSHVLDICLMFLRDEIPQKTELFTWRNYNERAEGAATWFNTGVADALPVDVEDTALAKVGFQSGVALEVELSWRAPVPNDYTYFTLYGTGGIIQLRTLFGFGTDRLWENDSLILDSSNGEKINICLDRKTNNTGRAFYEMAGYFINNIKGEAAGYLTMKDALRTVQVTEMLYNSEKNPTSDLRSMTTGYEEIG